ncbi:MAG: c-type cytochrome biogenesis protein CcmI [Alphaproteobacteria bacterium]|nr:c-type cytochrome biogenesis protein CcmI [Alphaproteobacteria bacterium]
MIHVLLGALTVLVVAALVWPLVRRTTPLPARAAYDLEVHRDQLAELGRDVERGTITEIEARAARAEIGRRMLTLADGAAAMQEAPMRGKAARIVAVLLAIALPAGAFGIYLEQGSPELPGLSFAERQVDDAARIAADRQLAAFARAMYERVERNPADLEAWVRIAQASTALNLPDKALEAWRKADELSGGQPEIAGPLAEAAIAVANGQVTPEAEGAFSRVLEADPGDPRARYYMGLARAQSGDRAGAVRIWFDLAAASAHDAPWLPTVREALDKTAREARIDTRRLKPSPNNPKAVVRLGAPKVGGGDKASDQIAGLPDADRMAAIRNMVDGLAARLETQPDDLEGWRRLARSRKVLGEPEKSLAAHARAAAIAPDNLDVLRDYAAALLDMHDAEKPLDPPARTAMSNLLAKSPNEGTALWLMGQDEALAGNAMVATALWQRLLALMPPDAPARADLQRRIDRLKAAK